MQGNVGKDQKSHVATAKTQSVAHSSENPLAQQIVAGKFATGDTVEVDASGRHLVLDSVVEGELLN